MRRLIFFPLTLTASLFAATCFSQLDKSNPTHPVLKTPHTRLTVPYAGLLRPDSLYALLRLAKTSQQRADIYYWFAIYYADQLKIDSGLYYAEKVNDESEKGDYEKGKAKYCLAKSITLFYRDKMDIPGLTNAVAIFRAQKDDFFTGRGYRELGRQYERLNELKKSRAAYREAIAVLSASGEMSSLQRVYYDLGSAFYKTFEIDSAAYYIFHSLQMAEKMQDTGRICYSSGLLGELYLANGDYEKAAKYLGNALEWKTPSVSRIILRIYYASYAECLACMAKFEKAGAMIKEYELINEKLGDNWGNINLEKLKGIYHYYKGNYVEALSHLQAAYRRVNEIAVFSTHIKSIAYHLGRTEYRLGLYDSAIVHFAHVRRIALRWRSGADLLDVTLLASEAWEKMGRTDSAYRYFRLYEHLKDSLMTFQKEKTVMELTAKYETDKKEKEIQLLQKEKEISSFELRAKTDQLEKQNLESARKSQQLILLGQQNEINRLEASEKSLALDNQQKEVLKKQNELSLVIKEKELQAAIAAKETQFRNFALIVVAAVLLFSGYVLYRYVQNKKLSKQLTFSLTELKQAQEQLIRVEKEKEAENVRVRISQDIHDEVGATLSGVALFSEIAREKMRQHKEQDAMEYLEHISVNSKQMVDKMSDIVWAIDPVNDSFDSMIEKIQSYTANLCAGKNIMLHTDIRDGLRNHQPSMEVKRNLYLLIKEAVNNAVKYSGATNIWLIIGTAGNQLAAEVRDDGIGFDPSFVVKGNGLNNMRSRAANLGGNLSLESAKEKGTTIRLRFNFHPIGGEVALQ